MTETIGFFGLGKMGVPMDVAGAVDAIWRKAAAEFGPESDFTNIVRLVEQRAGIEIYPRPTEPES